MEIGAVKHVLNSEIISLKAMLNQARTHTINKLTRKSKVFKKRKGPESEKFNRKAETCLTEVFIMKKIKAKELMRFAITSDECLEKYINHPEVNKEKAMARLLLHKSLQDRTILLKKKFGNMPIDELMMTRRERLKIKKEKKEKEKNKRKEKPIKEDNNGEGDHGGSVNSDDGEEDVDYDDEDEEKEHSDGDSVSSADDESDDVEMVQNRPEYDEDDDEREKLRSSESEDSGSHNEDTVPDPKMIKQHNNNNTTKIMEYDLPSVTALTKTAPTKKSTAKNKKNVKPQVKKKGKLQKVLKAQCVIDNEQKPEAKIVDSFFITSGGNNYKTLAEPRLPDDLGKVNRGGNRQMRRAAAFGRTYKPKFNRNFKEQPVTDRKDRYLDRKSERNQQFNKSFSNKKEDKNNFDKFSTKKRNISEKPTFDKRKSALTETKNEKLHPSWEAKKKSSGIQAFKGKKVVFDND